MAEFVKINFMEAMNMLENDNQNDLYFINASGDLSNVSGYKLVVTQLKDYEFYKYNHISQYEKERAERQAELNRGNVEVDDDFKSISVQKNVFDTLFIRYNPDEFRILNSVEGEVLLIPLSDD